MTEAAQHQREPAAGSAKPLQYIIGVDLGQAHDRTALCVLEQHQRPTGRLAPPTRRPVWGRENNTQTVQLESTYQVRHLERLEVGTPYPEQVKRIQALHKAVESIKPAGHKAVALVVDQTGVGRPVVDMLRAAGLRALQAVTIHGGDQVNSTGREHRVPKRELVSVLQVLLQGNRLQVAAALPDAQTLTREMLAFKVTISNTGHDSYGNDWRENAHDDLVLATALAVWLPERCSS